MKNNVTQLHNVDPEEFKKEILNGIRDQIRTLAENFTPKEPNQWISRKEASELLGVSLVTIHDWSKKGILHPYKMGNRVRFKLSEIERSLLQSNEKTQE